MGSRDEIQQYVDNAAGNRVRQDHCGVSTTAESWRLYQWWNVSAHLPRDLRISAHVSKRLILLNAGKVTKFWQTGNSSRAAVGPCHCRVNTTAETCVSTTAYLYASVGYEQRIRFDAYWYGHEGDGSEICDDGRDVAPIPLMPRQPIEPRSAAVCQACADCGLVGKG